MLSYTTNFTVITQLAVAFTLILYIIVKLSICAIIALFNRV